MSGCNAFVTGLTALVCLGTGCAHRPVLPMTAEALGADGTAAALVAYLGQPGADGRVCAGDELVEKVRSADDLRAPLMEALQSGAIAPPVWAACVTRLLPVLAPRRATRLLEDVLDAELELLRAPEVEREPVLQERLDALQRISVYRDPGVAASQPDRDSALKALAALGKGVTLGPLARSEAGRLTAALEAERGRWGGLPADGGAIAARGAARDEASLVILSRRLPDPALRGEAERQLVRLRIATTPHAEVRAAAGVVEETVLLTGANPISLAEHPPARAALDADRVPAVSVLVRQDPAHGVATLLAPTGGGAMGVLPPVPLRDALAVEAQGVSRPVTVCAPGRALDPTPCLAPQDVALETTLARVDDGAVVLAGEVPSAVVAELAHRGRLEVPVRVGGLAAGGFAWPVAFERPPDVVREADRAGAAGPDLEVVVERVAAERLVYTVNGAWVAAVERADAFAFRILSLGGRGAAGEAGSAGQSGASGASGESASCPPFGHGAASGGAGAAGSNGGDGGAGGPGGRGGDVRVTVVALPELRDDTLALVHATIRSLGGPGGQGGPGGSGGSGGAGGSGGSGTTCSSEHDGFSSFPSGTDGPRGADGASGSAGPDGPAGSPGRVTIELRRP